MRVIDLFAGCGGMSLGFENAGFDIIAAFDNWDAAIKIYESNFSHPIYKKDLSKDDIIQQLSDMRPDVIMGGPPCQDFHAMPGNEGIVYKIPRQRFYLFRTRAIQQNF